MWRAARVIEQDQEGVSRSSFWSPSCFLFGIRGPSPPARWEYDLRCCEIGMTPRPSQRLGLEIPTPDIVYPKNNSPRCDRSFYRTNRDNPEKNPEQDPCVGVRKFCKSREVWFGLWGAHEAKESRIAVQLQRVQYVRDTMAMTRV